MRDPYVTFENKFFNMKFLSKLLGGGASDLIDSISNTVDKFTLSKQEKQDFKLEVQQKLLEADRMASENYQKELETRADIIKAEMAQGDFVYQTSPSDDCVCRPALHFYRPCIGAFHFFFL